MCWCCWIDTENVIRRVRWTDEKTKEYRRRVTKGLMNLSNVKAVWFEDANDPNKRF